MGLRSKRGIQASMTWPGTKVKSNLNAEINHNNHLQLLTICRLGPEPRTAAEEPNALKILGVRRESLKNVFIEHIANAAHLMTVESRYPRGTRGDAFISFDLESDRGPVAALLDAFLDRDNRVTDIPEAFGHTIATAVDQCDLRNWEKQKGYVDTTNCVKVKMIYRVDLRICDDATLANILHS